jgi:iron complex outermembrane recepter protein
MIQPYLHKDKGRGDWTAPSYGSTWSPDPIYFRETQYDNSRYGTNAKLQSKFAGNALEIGLWYESNSTHMVRPGWRLADWQSGPTTDFTQLIRLFFDRQGDITTTMAYAQNTNTLLDDRLKLTYGAKYLNVDAKFHSNGNTLDAPTYGDPDRPDLDVTAKGNFLPQVGAVFSLNAHEELFANYAENINQYPLSAQLSAFCASVYANVGTVTSKGMEGLLVWEFAPRFSWGTSASYNVSKINDDYSTESSTGTTVVQTAGKDVVDAPRLMVSSAIRFDDSRWSADVGARYVDKRYFTILNTLSVPS